MPAFAREFTVFVDAINADASRAIADAARRGEAEIAAEQASRRGVVPGIVSAVDGQRGKAFESVKPNGQIVILFDYFAEIVYALFQELTARSPVVSGEYRKSHFCMIDGIGLPPLTVPTPAQVLNASRLTVTNPLRYAMKLERGKTKGGGNFVRQVNPFIYESAMEVVRREFGSVAKISYGNADLEGAYLRTTNRSARGYVTIKNNHRIHSGGRKDRRAGSAVHYPAIFIDRV